MTEQIEPREMTKDQLKSLALKQRIGEITSQYEDQIADNRAEYTQQFNAFQEALRERDVQIDSLQEQLRKRNESLQEEDTTTSD